MIEKDVAINILEDIERCLYDENWKYKTLSSVDQYIKGLEIAVDEELKQLIDEYQECADNSDEAMLLADKINKKYYLFIIDRSSNGRKGNVKFTK